MQGGWSNADSDWQLKRLQHDSVKTVEKAVHSMRGVLQQDIIAHGQEYERMFGKSSAQYNEYLNMVVEKLEQLGIAPKQVIEWLNQTATDGAVPVSQYGTDRDSQSETIPQIRAEAIPYDQQLQPQVDFESFARLEAAASQALTIGTIQTPAPALPFSAFPSGQALAPMPTATSFPSSQFDSNQAPCQMSAQTSAPMAQPTFQSSLLSNSAAWGSPTPGQTPPQPTTVAEAWGLDSSAEPKVPNSSNSSVWGEVIEVKPEPIAAKVTSSWASAESTNSLKSALGMASAVVQSANTKPVTAVAEEFNYETTWSEIPVASSSALAPTQHKPVATAPAQPASSWVAEPEPPAPALPQGPTWNAAPVSAPFVFAMPQEPAWNTSSAPASAAASAPAPFVSSVVTANSAAIANSNANSSPSLAANPGSSQTFTQWGASTSVMPQTQTAHSLAAESQWAAPPFPIPSPTLGPALTPSLMTAGPMMAPISHPAALPQASPVPILAPLQPTAPMQAVAPVVKVAPVIPVATQIPANDQSATNQTRPSFGGWPAEPAPNPYATQDAIQKPALPQQQQLRQPVSQPAAQPAVQAWTQTPQLMQNNPIAVPQYQNAAFGNGVNGGNTNGHQVLRQEEREEPNYDPATAWD